MDLLYFILLIFIWFVLQKWILPKMGISTWLNPNTCRGPINDKSNTIQQIDENTN